MKLLCTNKLLSFHTRNTISLNIIGGHSKGLNGVEIGGVYNYDDGDVYGVQVAGVVNAVSKDVVGTQISGVMNAVKGNVKGVQIAGVINNNDSITTGIQISGVYQKTHTLRGFRSVDSTIVQSKPQVVRSAVGSIQWIVPPLSYR